MKKLIREYLQFPDAIEMELVYDRVGPEPTHIKASALGMVHSTRVDESFSNIEENILDFAQEFMESYYKSSAGDSFKIVGMGRLPYLYKYNMRIPRWAVTIIKKEKKS